VSEQAPPYRVDATGSCPFCRVDRGRIAWSSPLAIALWDVYPVSLGHALVVPRRHAASWSELTVDECFHVHLIPRYQGAVLDPRGGVRWVMPDKAAYWLSTEQ
jgi:diadenosine tetraphosphate (Ap4A) HIT family hydrolase